MARIASFVAALVLSIAGAAAAEEDPLKARHGDWEVRCPENGSCYMSQIATNDAGAPMLAVAIVRAPANDNDVRGMMRLQAPLGVLLPRGLEMRVDGGEAIGAPFLYCDGAGCIAQIGLGDEGLNTLRRGAAAVARIYSVQAAETPVDVRISLMGFTRGYEDLN